LAGPIPLLDHVLIRVTGPALAATAVAASFAAQSAMGPSWRTTVDPNERPPLVTGGIFHVVRNPIYSALIIMLIGLTRLVPNAIALAGLALMITGSQLQVRLIEEPYLHRIHGNQLPRVRRPRWPLRARHRTTTPHHTPAAAVTRRTVSNNARPRGSTEIAPAVARIGPLSASLGERASDPHAQAPARATDDSCPARQVPHNRPLPLCVNGFQLLL
jgi:Phospholipid methyltransferase